MKKSTKGAMAAVAAAVLLIGGAGTLAFWSDDAAIDGGTIDTGTLALSDTDCADGWVYAPGNASAGESVDVIVPGDSIAMTCDLTITATGDNLEAVLTTPDDVAISDPADTTTFQANVTAAYAIDGDDIPAVITSENDGDTVTATITVEFPFGDADAINANDTQGVTAALDEIEITLVQQES